MTSFALYRLPYQTTQTLMVQHEGQPRELKSFTELNGKNGFVMAPFAVSPDQPMLLIEPEEIKIVDSGECRVESLLPQWQTVQVTGAVANSPFYTLSSQLPNRARYHIDFSNFHSNLLNGEFQKIVLSRCVQEKRREEQSPLTLFQKACDMYPRMFISLVYTPQSGMWLMATPEILLEGGGNDWHTIALAGTMKLEGESLSFDSPPSQGEMRMTDITWTTKNIQEQRYVATYLMECLEHFSSQITEEGPYTARAANLVHLRSDFNFVMEDTQRIGELIRSLHPTPAVCGLPKQQAFDFIRRNESQSRQYYSGFSGPLNLSPDSPKDAQTHLFVSLRCMQILADSYILYAGGGLLKDSVEEQEWEETEEKLETMRLLIEN
ncbi:MAG: chorismate-binding protein [Prevotella sp.]|nr:chorismate-binding protein [Prevotella sp.]